MKFEKKNAPFATVLLIADVLSLATTPARAQQTSGTYRMSGGGNAISTENYALVSEPDGTLRAEAEITISGSKRFKTEMFRWWER